MGDRGAEPLREMRPLCQVSNIQASTNSPPQWVVIPRGVRWYPAGPI